MFRLAFDVLSFRKTDLSRRIIAWEESTSFEVGCSSAEVTLK